MRESDIHSGEVPKVVDLVADTLVAEILRVGER